MKQFTDEIFDILQLVSRIILQNRKLRRESGREGVVLDSSVSTAFVIYIYFRFQQDSIDEFQAEVRNVVEKILNCTGSWRTWTNNNYGIYPWVPLPKVWGTVEATLAFAY